MLLGEYRRRVDNAGWLCLPGGIRNALHELYAPDDTTLVLSMFFKGCVSCFPVVEWYKTPERLRRIGAPPLDIRDYFASAAACPLDTQGRLYLPHVFCEYAAIERDVLLIGVICSLELWAPIHWKGYVGWEA
jgi:MraZ protein